MAISTLGEAVDLDRYPIHDLDGPGGQALLARVRSELAAVGASDLHGFLRPEAVERTLEGVADVPAFHMEQRHDIEFTGRDPGSMTADDPLRVQVRSAKGAIAYDAIPDSSPLRTVYESGELTRFVSAAVGVDPLYRQADEIGALNVMVYGLGDELGWHFDNADFVVTIMLRRAGAGGAFEYVPMLRAPDATNPDAVRALLAGDRRGVRHMDPGPGTLTLFRGRLSPHRVTPVAEAPARINATLAYATTPDARLSASARRIFYGRD
jgi:hypothetical protein